MVNGGDEKIDVSTLSVDEISFFLRLIGHNIDNVELFGSLYQRLSQVASGDNGILSKYAVQEKYKIYAMFYSKFFKTGKISNQKIGHFSEITPMLELYGSEIIGNGYYKKGGLSLINRLQKHP